MKIVSILRQSRRFYGCWPLKRGIIATGEKQQQQGCYTIGFGKAKATAGGILPEFSTFYRHPGRAGGSPFGLEPRLRH
jgi:hypothetical protein